MSPAPFRENRTCEMRALSDVLSAAESLPWDHALFLAADRNWTLDSVSMVLSTRDCGSEEVPEPAAANGLIYALNVAQVQDIVCNARQQRPDCSTEDLLEAFLYYHKYDAFLVFE